MKIHVVHRIHNTGFEPNASVIVHIKPPKVRVGIGMFEQHIYEASFDCWAHALTYVANFAQGDNPGEVTITGDRTVT